MISIIYNEFNILVCGVDGKQVTEGWEHQLDLALYLIPHTVNIGLQTGESGVYNRFQAARHKYIVQALSQLSHCRLHVGR